MTQTQKMISNSKKEINLYINDVISSSRDSIDLINLKIEIHKNVIYSLRDNELNDENKNIYDEIASMLTGLRKVKGESNVDLIEAKINVLCSQVQFLKDIKE